MTRNVTVVRNNKDLAATVAKIAEFEERYQNVSLADKGGWTNQNLIFARSLGEMVMLARVITQGALQRDECRGAHYKPDFQIAGPDAEDRVKLREQATRWCQAFKKQSDQWLKTTVATYTPSGPKISYEDVDTSLIPPRPRTYGLKGAEIIEEVWRDMTRPAKAVKEAVAV